MKTLSLPENCSDYFLIGKVTVEVIIHFYVYNTVQFHKFWIILLYTDTRFVHVLRVVRFQQVSVIKWIELILSDKDLRVTRIFEMNSISREMDLTLESDTKYSHGYIFRLALFSHHALKITVFPLSSCKLMDVWSLTCK